MPSFVTEGRTLHYTQEGEGPVLLFLHGLGGNAENWILQRKAFSAERRVVALDLPGHGHSDGRDVAFKDYWKSIGALCRHLDAGPITICGLSKGARAGLMLAARHPELVERIAVINAFVHLNPGDAQMRRDLYNLLLEPDGPRRWALRLLDLMGVSAHGAIVRGFLRSLETIEPRHIWSIFQELLAFDQRPELAEVRCPTLLVRGERDTFVPPYCVDELAELLPSAAVVRMKGCGHLPYLEMPRRFNQELTRFLSD